MCQVSDKIKFCTCVDPDIEIEELDFYWILHRYSPKDVHEHIMGTVMPPSFDIDTTSSSAKQLILERIHDKSAFDVELNLQKGDVLEVYMNFEGADVGWNFFYEWQDSEWVNYDSPEPFHIPNNYVVKEEGNLEEVIPTKFMLTKDNFRYLKFEIGGYGTTNYELTFDVKKQSFSKGELFMDYHKEPINSSEEVLSKLLVIINEKNILQWSNSYMSLILDGCQWSIDIIYLKDGRRQMKRIAGSNSYPTGLYASSTDRSDYFQEIVDSLFGLFGENYD